MIGATTTCRRSRQPADKETRERVGAALDEHAAQSDLGEAGEDRGRRDMSVYRRQSEYLDAGKLATRALRHHDNSARAVVGEQAGGRRKPAARIDDDARRIGAGDVTNRQSRVVRERAADPDDDGVDQRAQPMQMRETGRSVDVAEWPVVVAMRPSSDWPI